MATEKDIKYINREFGDFRTQLTEFAKNYFPDSYNDFSPTSPGMMFIEMAAYVGDVLSFYQDNQLQETFLQHAKNPANLYTLAYMMGYRPKVATPSEAILKVSQTLEARSGSQGYTPDWSSAARIEAGSTFTSTDNSTSNFILDKAIDFTVSSSYDKTDIRISEIDDEGIPTEYNVSKEGYIYSGEIVSTTFDFTTAQKFATVSIDDTDIIRVLDITDSDGGQWTEVPYLGQDTVFSTASNSAIDSDKVPYNLELTKVPKRFITRFTSTGQMQIQFGAGITAAEDTEFLPDPTTIEKFVDKHAIDKLDQAYDPTNFLFSKTYGVAPSNTTLTVRYVKGGGISSNVPANSISEGGVVVGSNLLNLTYTNDKPAQGGRDADTVEELRENSLKAYTEQKRAVTIQDYTLRALSLPSQFGSVAKVYVAKESLSEATSVLDVNPLAISLYVLAYDSNGHLVNATTSLKQNLKKYLSEYMMITDSIDIKDAFVVNVGVKFEILTLPTYPSREVLLACNNITQDFFKTARMSINSPLNLSQLYTRLDKVKGVQTVKNITVENKQGGNYSEYAYDVKGAIKDNIVYPSYDPCIFEVKYPNIDIEGRVTTL